MKLEPYYLMFLDGNSKFCYNKYIYKKHSIEPITYDKLFFNFLIVASPEKLSFNYTTAIERQLKYEFSHKLENTKFKKLDNVINNLCYDDTINLYTLCALFYIINKSCLYSHNNLFCHLNKSNIGNMCYLVNKEKDIYLIKHEKYNDIVNNGYEIVNILKPVYTISYYKLVDLEKMINDMNIKIDESKNYKKKELYEIIIQYLNSNFLKN